MTRPEPAPPAWTSRDSLAALGWFVTAIVARSILLARVENVLDHDQAIVGLMALDISEGRRWPIFFDGQRYMGAIEAYTAALFVRLFGHSPTAVALAPTTYFAGLVAGQYAAWRAWSGRSAGHLAALVSVACSPMMALWGVIPRGGYPEVMAWGLATIAVYRRLTRPDRPALGLAGQVGWGLLFGLGYFINPLSLVVYLTIALDWTFGRHGLDLRSGRASFLTWTDRPWAIWIWACLGAAALTTIGVGCHVRIVARGATRYVFGLDLLPKPVGAVAGTTLVVAVIGLAAWWSGLASRVRARLAGNPGFAIGVVLALSPFLIYSIRARLGLGPYEPSLPVWIRPPWAIGPNLSDGLGSLGPVLAGETRSRATPFLSLSDYRIPAVAWPVVSRGLAIATPWVAGLVALLIATAAYRDRDGWRDFVSLRGAGPTRPTVSCLLGLGTCLGLYSLQTTALDGASIRYLMPVWIFLPGLLASGLIAWPKAARTVAAVFLIGVWAIGQANLRAEMRGPNPERALVDRLEAGGVRAIVARGPVVHVVAVLSQGRVGGVEFHSHWARLGGRYADRFVAGQGVVCVVEVEGPGDRATSAAEISDDPGALVRDLAAKMPGRARLVDRVGNYQIWRVEMPLAEFLEEPASPLPGARRSAIVTR